MTRSLFTGGRIFTGFEDGWAEAMLIEGEELLYVGDNDTAVRHAGPDISATDLAGRVVLPGFTDAHTHLVMMGDALGRVQLTDARSVDQIQQRLRAARKADPTATRLLGTGWLFDSIDGGLPTAAMIDAAVPDIPVYLDANDYHSCWINTAAMAELGITAATEDPLGGSISRDQDGQPTGLLYETAAQQHAWAYVASVTTDSDRDQAVERMLSAYAEAGVTGAVDMALDELGLAALQRAAMRRGGRLPLRVAAHWFIENTGDDAANLAQVQRAAELSIIIRSPWLRVVGIKLVLDGVIDACTAALSQPYSNGSSAELIWPVEALAPVVVAADAADLQIALHAIGDRASTVALDAIENAMQLNGERERRHRIEHLEYAAPGTAERMARLGVTASMQPVHADPAIFDNWAAMLGDERVERAFAWREYVDAGALLAFSTDAPTAPYAALPNVYVAATRASALDASFAPRDPAAALTLTQALVHATRDAAASVVGAENRGSLVAGNAADFVIINGDPFEQGVDKLLSATVVRTVVAGESVYDAAVL
ncbi:amidohydrolase [Salinibacterium sp. NK8237]|uniref:amidohydrolase n=1 Tax=Salinibacterium sp. NK8237 TaxID=2792038 RepID=UPI0018CE6378|nr:amidohydrolase [Salinibacterium sp. NK8237]MBH0129989.1 amidohydrolase [Salinibacterium sp. NK8237]